MRESLKHGVSVGVENVFRFTRFGVLGGQEEEWHDAHTGDEESDDFGEGDETVFKHDERNIAGWGQHANAKWGSTLSVVSGTFGGWSE